MTKIEYTKCIALAINALFALDKADKAYKKSHDYLKIENITKWEVEQRKADQYYGGATRF